MVLSCTKDVLIFLCPLNISGFFSRNSVGLHRLSLLVMSVSMILCDAPYAPSPARQEHHRQWLCLYELVLQGFNLMVHQVRACMRPRCSTSIIVAITGIPAF